MSCETLERILEVSRYLLVGFFVGMVVFFAFIKRESTDPYGLNFDSEEMMFHILENQATVGQMKKKVKEIESSHRALLEGGVTPVFDPGQDAWRRFMTGAIIQTDGMTFVLLTSMGVDGKPGTDDDLYYWSQIDYPRHEN